MSAADLWEKIYIKDPDEDGGDYVLFIDDKFIGYAKTSRSAWHKAENYIDNEFKKERDNKSPRSDKRKSPGGANKGYLGRLRGKGK